MAPHEEAPPRLPTKVFCSAGKRLIRWQQSHRFSFLFFSLILLIVILPYFSGSFLAGIPVPSLLTGLVCITAIIALTGNRRRFLTGAAAGIVVFSTDVLAGVMIHPLTRGIALCVAILFYIYTLKTIIVPVLRPRVVSVDTIAGGIAAYLLIGITYATGCYLIQTLMPGSFVASADALAGEAVDFPQLIYVTFITQTSCGFGDIIPTTPQARTILLFTAVTGVLYIAIMIAGIVSVYLSHHRSQHVG